MKRAYYVVRNNVEHFSRINFDFFYCSTVRNAREMSMKLEKDKEEGVMQKEGEGAKKCENSVT